MCKSNGESVNHIHIHCPITMELWFMVFTLYGIHWVMLKIVVEILASWKGSLGDIVMELFGRLVLIV